MLANIPNTGIIQKTDWGRLKSAFDLAVNRIESGRWDHRKTSLQFGGSADSMGNNPDELYSLGELGSVFWSRSKDNTVWPFFFGKIVESMLPWVQPIRTELAKANIDIRENNVMYVQITSTSLKHDDKEYTDGILSTEDQAPHTNINYVISSETPEESYTSVWDDQGNEQRYYSHPGQMWIVNASNKHQVITKAPREVIIIKTRSPWERVAEFFEQHQDFFDESNSYFKS